MESIQKKRLLELEPFVVWINQVFPDDGPICFRRERHTRPEDDLVKLILNAMDNQGNYRVELDHGVLQGKREGRVKKVVFATPNTRILGQYFEQSFSLDEYLKLGNPKKVLVDLNLTYSVE